jgi:hypothetical protein
MEQVEVAAFTAIVEKDLYIMLVFTQNVQHSGPLHLFGKR